MARYELVDGTSGKFWEIAVRGASIRITAGKLGSPGASTLRELDSAAEARAEHDELVAEKLKKGYRLSAKTKRTQRPGAAAADGKKTATRRITAPSKAADKTDKGKRSGSGKLGAGGKAEGKKVTTRRLATPARPPATGAHAKSEARKGGTRRVAAPAKTESKRRGSGKLDAEATGASTGAAPPASTGALPAGTPRDPVAIGPPDPGLKEWATGRIPNLARLRADDPDASTDELAFELPARLPQAPGRAPPGLPAPPSTPAKDALVGDSSAMRHLLARIDAALFRQGHVLLAGESGTRKDLVAARIHAQGLRHNGPFVTSSCVSLPAPLLGVELFERDGGGMSKAAHGGVLLLEEISELDPALQDRLLPILERADVRVIAATRVDLEQRVQDGRFRRALLDRLRETHIEVPPLREHLEDLPALVEHFLRLRAPGRPVELTPAAWERLRGYRFPGNVRELEHVIERALRDADGNTIEAEHLALDREPLAS